MYNQTGEGYFDQLKTYNHMTTHLKKVYQAKCVVDSRNQNYLINKQQRCRSLCRDKSLEKCTSQDVIDRLAFDTQHHPIVIKLIKIIFQQQTVHLIIISSIYSTGCFKNGM